MVLPGGRCLVDSKTVPRYLLSGVAVRETPPQPPFPLPRNMDWPQWGLLVYVLPSPHPASL